MDYSTIAYEYTRQCCKRCDDSAYHCDKCGGDIKDQESIICRTNVLGSNYHMCNSCSNNSSRGGSDGKE